MIKILKNLNKKEIGIFIICFILIFIQVWLDLKMPDYMSKITVLVQTEGSKMSDIIINGMVMPRISKSDSIAIRGWDQPDWR